MTHKSLTRDEILDLVAYVNARGNKNHPAFKATGEKQRLFLPLMYQADSWGAPRQVTIKCEFDSQGANRRAVSTNRPGWAVLPGAVYEEYVDRGESENRNKELKREFAADRTSDHRFFANYFRLYLHAAALNLLVRLRRATSRGLQPQDVGVNSDLPAEALPPKEKKTYFNRRRRDDALGEGFACTWRTQLIKVAAEISVSARRIVVRLSGSWPYLNEYVRISQAVLAYGNST